MALVQCKECKGEVSSSAKTCPHCGKKLKMGWFAKLLIGVVALVAAFLIFGAMIPENEAKANRARRVCETEMIPKGLATQYSCDQMYDKIRSGR